MINHIRILHWATGLVRVWVAAWLRAAGLEGALGRGAPAAASCARGRRPKQSKSGITPSALYFA